MPHARRTRLTRRAALGSLGAAGAAAFLRPFRSEAQPAASPQRLLLIHRPCGTVPAKWWPSGGVTDWVSSSILSSFDKLRNDMVILKGVDCPRIQDWLGDKAGAGMIAMISPPPMDKAPDLRVWPVLPGYTFAEQQDTNGKFFTATDKSIDQLLLEKVASLSAARIPSIQLTASQQSANARADSCLRVVSYSKPTPTAQLPTALWPEYRPSIALANIFGGAMGPPGNAAEQALEKSMLDFVVGDLTRLRPRLPMSQLPRIDAHLTSLRELEKSVAMGMGPPCTTPTLGPLPTAPLGGSDEDAQCLELCKQHMQIIKSAFQCDLTRVASFTYGWGNSSIRFSNVLPAGTVTDTEGHFNISHLGGNNPLQALEAIEKFYADMTASLLWDMKNTPDGAGSLLDNTLVVYWNHFSDGNSNGIVDVPVLLFGGKFLNLQGGKFLDFGKNGRTMADVWVATAQAWGYKAMTSYGAPMWNRGPMTGLYG